MFEHTILVGTGRTRRPWTVPVSFAGQIAVVGIAVLFPLVFTEKLPRARLLPQTVTAPVRLGPHTPTGGSVVQVVQAIREPRTGVFVAPTRVPSGVHLLAEAPALHEMMDPGPECIGASCGPVGDPNGIRWGVPPIVGQSASAPPPPVVRPPEPVRPVEPRAPIRVVVGGLVQEAKLISRPKPVYPHLAIVARVSGVVRLAAVIGTDGQVRELRAVSGHPMLVPAAMDAVRQWHYRPTLLNGIPVEVDTEIVVMFNLAAN